MALKFGTFMAPFHCPVGQDPTAAYRAGPRGHPAHGQARLRGGVDRRAPLVRARADPRSDDLHRLGRAPRPGTSSSGTGVLSLPYHNPLWVADRALFLDRLLRGRFMLGLGPGALPTDATMIGISLEEQRGAFEEDVDVLMAILRGEKVTAKTNRYNLVDAQTQFAPYSDFDIVVAAIACPTGPARGGEERRRADVRGRDRQGRLRRAGPALGRHGGAGAAVRAHRPTAASGASPARCTSPRPRSRRSRTSATASTPGATTPRTCSPRRTSGLPARPSRSGSPGSTRPASA